jgi:putative ABC transport system permease protein
VNLGESVNVSLQGLQSHKLRSLLTMLGIIFGVAAVIAMLSIGEGAKQQALEQIKLMGINNVIIRDTGVVGGDEAAEDQRSNFSRGITLQDVASIAEVLPTTTAVAPQKEFLLDVTYADLTVSTTVLATTPDYARIFKFVPTSGTFLTDLDLRERAQICVLSSDIKEELFYFRDPIGEKVRLGSEWFTVVGVMERRAISSGTSSEVVARDVNRDIYVPLTSAHSRFILPTLASPVDQVTLEVSDSQRISESAVILNRLMLRRHNGIADFRIIIPEELMRQSQETQRIWGIVMGAIAGISLLVGGIGIMNIMLATVLERTKEIGVRRAVGATRQDILSQFLVEAVFLSFLGGLIGIGLGYSLTKIISIYAQWRTIVSVFAVALSFGVSAAVGIIFGIYPARKAARLDPIESLRYE